MYHIRDYLRKKYQIKVEPYWNVNITHFNPSILGISIKVEPYWNVNKNQEFKNKEIQDN